jgi:hypothetical protein
MTLTLHLTPEIEAMLKEQSTQSGKSPETLALEAIEDQLLDKDESSDLLPYEVWKKRLDLLLEYMPRGNPDADFDRESIYEGRGT